MQIMLKDTYARLLGGDALSQLFKIISEQQGLYVSPYSKLHKIG